MIPVAILVTVLLFQGEDGRTQSSGMTGGIFFAPNPGRTVTLTRNGALLASFTFPNGTFLDVSYDAQEPTSIAAGRWEFHGNFTLRAQPAQGAPATPLERRLQAPLVLTVQGANVLIENVTP
jgi:hypothetical protein